MKKLILLLILLLFSASAYGQQLPKKQVLKVTSRHNLKKWLGSGVLIQIQSGLVLTNYHVSKKEGSEVQIEGLNAQLLYSYTSEKDAGATEQTSINKDFKLVFNRLKDLAVYKFKQPLLDGFTEVSFVTSAPVLGQSVLMISRYDDKVDIKPAKIIGILDNCIVLDIKIRGGNSGGGVFDQKSHALLGIVTGNATVSSKSTNKQLYEGALALGVPIISSFIQQKDPVLWRAIFSDKGIANLQWQDSDVTDEAGSTDSILSRSATVSMEVKLTHQPVLPSSDNSFSFQMKFIRPLLDQNSVNLSLMQNVLAVETIKTWGQDAAEKTARYRTMVEMNRQTFWQINKDGTLGKEIKSPPRPKSGILPIGFWYETLQGVPTTTIEYLGIVEDYKDMSGRIVSAHVYSYSGYCRLSEKNNNDCSGKIVADEKFNILEISRESHPDFSDDTRIVIAKIDIRYGFVKFDQGRRLLLPIKLEACAQFKNNKWYYATNSWDYRLFHGNEPKVVEVDDP